MKKCFVITPDNLYQCYLITQYVRINKSNDGYCHSTMREISSKLDIEERDLSNIIFWLQKIGLLEVCRGNGGNRYRVKNLVVERESKSPLRKDAERIYTILKENADSQVAYRVIISQKELSKISGLTVKRTIKCIDYLYYHGRITIKPQGRSGSEYILLQILQEEVDNNGRT